MSGNHTQEPWHVGENSTIVYANDGFAVANASVFHGRVEPNTSVANASRIVACVNACAGISQQYLEELNGETLADKQVALMKSRDDQTLIALRKQNILDAVCKQRDGLLAALEGSVQPIYDVQMMLGPCDCDKTGGRCECCTLGKAMNGITTAIASVKGGA